MKFLIKKSSDNQFFFVLTAKNGKVIATSETYKLHSGCMKGIRSVQKTVPLATVVPFKV